MSRRVNHNVYLWYGIVLGAATGCRDNVAGDTGTIATAPP